MLLKFSRVAVDLTVPLSSGRLICLPNYFNNFPFRLLARLLYGTDPKMSLFYAQKASSLGDPQALHLEAEHLDNCLRDTKKYSSKRILVTSQILSKLDPSFSYNVSENAKMKGLGYLEHLLGIYLYLILLLYYPH